jgi:hypothetical protein
MQPNKAKNTDEQVLVTITVKRKKQKILYKVHCAKEVKNEQLAHYLDEIIEGICTWKPAICEEAVKSTIKPLNNPNKSKE